MYDRTYHSDATPNLHHPEKKKLVIGVKNKVEFTRIPSLYHRELVPEFGIVLQFLPFSET